MTYLAIIALAVVAETGTYLALNRLYAPANKNIAAYLNLSREKEREETRMRALDRLSATVSKLFPQSKQSSATAAVQLRQAGVGLTPDEWYTVQFACGVVGSLAGVLVSTLLPSPSLQSTLSLFAFGIAFGMLSPRFWLARRAASRRRAIVSSLPNTLELLAISVRAGLTPERAFRLVANRAVGPLADEFGIVDTEISVLGYSMPDALKNLADRCHLPQVTMFAAAVTQAVEQGSSIGSILESQAGIARDEYFQGLEETANKLSTKMVFPLVLFILPGVIIVSLAPAIFSIAETFSGI